MLVHFRQATEGAGTSPDGARKNNNIHFNLYSGLKRSFSLGIGRNKCSCGGNTGSKPSPLPVSAVWTSTLKIYKLNVMFLLTISHVLCQLAPFPFISVHTVTSAGILHTQTPEVFVQPTFLETSHPAPEDANTAL